MATPGGDPYVRRVVDTEPSAARERLVQLRAEIGALHRTAAQATTTAHWAQGRRRLREAVLADDPQVFLTWPVIRDTMLVAGERHAYLAAELAALQAQDDWSSRWRSACEDDGTGAPPPLPGLPGGSGNRLHHAYQFLQLERAGGGSVRDYRGVVEFGGGYGALCAVAHRLGFTGDYLLFDLPEWSALQRWYLGEIGLPTGDGSRVRVSSTEDDVVAARTAPGTLFVAMWSLSETPLQLRDRVLPGDDRYAGYLFGYQAQFEGIDNLAWFAQLRQDRPDVEWSGGEPEEGSGNRYLVGRRRA